MSPPLSLEECAELYEAMLVDVLEASADFAASLDLIPVLAFHPPDAVAELIGRTPPGFRLQVQRGVDPANEWRTRSQKLRPLEFPASFFGEVIVRRSSDLCSRMP
jgi:hypothetical protein